jgi:putative sigma-54 modulation protein
MKISIKGTHLDLTPSLKQYVEEKVGNLDKLMEPIETRVELERDQHHRTGEVFRAEVTMLAGSKVIRAEHSSDDIYSSIDLVVPKLKEQINKFKTKRSTIQKKNARSQKRKIE